MRPARFGAASVLWALSFVFLSGAVAKDIHVNNLAGDDAFSGRHDRNLSDRSGPVRTLARALEMASQGDRIILTNTGEPYRESITLTGTRHSGYSFRPFVIEGNGAILDGSAPVAADAWEHYEGPVYRFRPPRLRHQQMFLNDRPIARVAVDQNYVCVGSSFDHAEWCVWIRVFQAAHGKHFAIQAGYLVHLFQRLVELIAKSKVLLKIREDLITSEDITAPRRLHPVFDTPFKSLSCSCVHGGQFRLLDRILKLWIA